MRQILLIHHSIINRKVNSVDKLIYILQNFARQYKTANLVKSSHNLIILRDGYSNQPRELRLCNQ